MTEFSEHVRGPWQAFLATEDGSQVFATLTDVPAGVEVAVTVLRGKTLTAALGGFFPDDHDLDELDELDVLYLMTPDDTEDWPAQLPARWEQAKAVTDALNAVPGQPDTDNTQAVA